VVVVVVDHCSRQSRQAAGKAFIFSDEKIFFDFPGRFVCHLPLMIINR
jgi:hypothetical protein